MPKRSKIKSLKYLCIISVAKNMEYWCGDYRENFLPQGKVLYVVSPFDVLTADSLQILISVLAEYKLLKRYYLDILIDGILDCLDLSTCRNVSNKESIASLIATRCKRLKVLNMSTLNQIPCRALVDVISALPCLTVLNLKQTKSNDQVLNKIGQTCTNLRDLNISSCPVTDSGIMSLCLQRTKTTYCNPLLKLDVSNTVVSVKGVEIAIANLPRLQILIYPDICEVLYKMFNAKHTSADSKHSLLLKYLSIQLMNPTLSPVTETIKVSVTHCPNITEVYFHRGVNDEGILALSSLQNLKILHVANCEERLLTFENGILPLLQSSGKTIEKLYLNEINDIDIAAIGFFCPIIQNFSFLISSFSTANMYANKEFQEHNGKLFTQLEELSLQIHTELNNITEMALHIILDNAIRVHSLYIEHLDSFSDNFLNRLLENNPMLYLQKLHLESCNSITGEQLWNLLCLENMLESMTLLHCFQVTRADYEQFDKFCQDQFYEIKILWV